MILRSEDLSMRMGKSTMTFLAEIFLPIAVIIRLIELILQAGLGLLH